MSSFCELGDRHRADVDTLVDDTARSEVADDNTVVAGKVLLSPLDRLTPAGIIAASGPSTLLADLRITAAARMSTRLPSIHLQLEEFTW